ncbi:hypothetical protein JOE21_001097 [Desmospora profundinema]|uniref:Uncharacterized protein n=1 Tax=Desmospora profundinema TaxID=1571184 RepID=A0ABU1IK09_9BACL|nr:hypothetical protein [Desmospora profundinema]
MTNFFIREEGTDYRWSAFCTRACLVIQSFVSRREGRLAGGEPLRFLQRNEDSHTDLGSRTTDCSDTP